MRINLSSVLVDDQENALRFYTQQVFLRYCLQDVHVTSVQQSDSGGEDFSQENVSFAYATFSQQYTPQEAKGSGGPSVFAGWNATTGKLIATYPNPCGL